MPDTKKLPFLEDKKYDENATPEEIDAIESRVFMSGDKIIYFKEIKHITPFSVNIVFNKIDKLGESLGWHALIIDLRHANRPDSESRREINKRFSKACKNVKHVSYVIGSNILIRTAARFVMYQTKLDSYSIHKTMDGAFDAINNKFND